MSVSVTLNGTSYTIPQTGETGWGTQVTTWIQAVSNSCLQKTGGNFTLTAEVNFGSSYGLKAPYYKSSSADLASAGQIRLANTDAIKFRNAANAADLSLNPKTSADGVLQYNGVDLVDVSTAQTLTNKTLTAPVISSPTGLTKSDVGLSNVDNTSDATKDAAATSLTNKTIDADLNTISNIDNNEIKAAAGIVYSKLNLASSIVDADVAAAAAIARTKLASGTASHVLVNDGSGVMSSVSKLPETQGGTNQSTYTTGDLLFASASNTLSKLAIGTATQVLTVTGGVPAWGTGGAGGSGLGGSGVTSLKSADYTVVSGDNGYLIPVDTTSNVVVISLPQISSVSSSFNIIIKGTTGSAVTNPITIMPYSGDLIDSGDGGDIITGAYQGYAFVSNGTEWKKLAFTSASASGIRGVFISGRTGSGTQTSSIEYINSSTLGNGTSFGSVSQTRDRCSNGSINNSTRGVFAGGSNQVGTNLNSIEYITVPTLGNAVSFGTLANTGVCSSLSNSTRGIFCQSPGATSAIDYITIATTGNTTSFGTLATSRDNQAAGVASSTRGVISGGYNGGNATNSIEYITIASTGNGTSFGTLATARMYHGGFGNLVRGIYVAGLDSGSASIDNMEYITIATTGNGTSFGNIYSARNGVVGFSSSTRGIVAGGIGAANAVVNDIGYVTVATTGNTTSFGTLGTSRGGQGVACNFAK